MALGDPVAMPPGLRATSAAQAGGPPGGGPQPPRPGMPPTFAGILTGQNQPDVSAPGQGNQADGLTQLNLVVQWIEKILPLLGVGTPVHDAALKAAQSLSRMTGKAGGASLGLQQTAVRSLGQTVGQMGLLAQLNAQKSLGQQQGSQGPQGSPGPAGGQPAPAGPPNTAGAFPGA